jgi:diacylglycerol kinase family enzyme
VVQPVLEQAAGMQVSVVELQRPMHAKQVAQELDLGSTDLLACAGGDGTLWEALQVGGCGGCACW